MTKIRLLGGDGGGGPWRDYSFIPPTFSNGFTPLGNRMGVGIVTMTRLGLRQGNFVKRKTYGAQ